MRHFLTLMDFSADDLRELIERAIAVKRRLRSQGPDNMLQGRVLAMLFQKSSTRTRLSFESAMAQCGGHAIFLAPEHIQLGRGESVADTARVLSRMSDCVMVRTFAHETLCEFAGHSRVPVINGLTDEFHPCQLLADMQTFFEQRGDICGSTVAWIGDGNNMCHSYINAARQFEFNLNIAAPAAYLPKADVVTAAGDRVRMLTDPLEAARGAQLIVTDVWASMGQEQEAARRRAAFKDFCVDARLMAAADKDAIFMHCLPAHRGEEVTADVIDGSQSVVWEEAENRLHAQKALLQVLLGA
jgi:ornithine carbamoyltransferase